MLVNNNEMENYSRGFMGNQTKAVNKLGFGGGALEIGMYRCCNLKNRMHMMPKVMDNLMPHMIGDVVPLVTQPMIDYLRRKTKERSNSAA